MLVDTGDDEVNAQFNDLYAGGHQLISTGKAGVF